MEPIIVKIEPAPPWCTTQDLVLRPTTLVGRHTAMKPERHKERVQDRHDLRYAGRLIMMPVLCSQR